jgi:hypothetical protein
MEQKIVVHMKQGTIHKGITQDFDPTLDSFHVLPAEGGGVPIRVRVAEMKALFWVKDYIGNRHFIARRDFAGVDGAGRKAIVTFADGEEIWGTVDREPERGAGFFLYPADQRDNNVRIFVNRTALKELRHVP